MDTTDSARCISDSELANVCFRIGHETFVAMTILSL